MKRDLKLDRLKGFLMILVIYGHISFRVFSIQKMDLFSNVGTWTHFYHMPLFLALSVLFIKSDWRWLVKIAALILFPYCFWFFYDQRLLILDNTNAFFSKLFLGNWNSTKSIIWFLPTLFSLNLLFFYLIYHQNHLK